MKKLIFALATLILLLALTALPASALQDGDFTYTVNSDGTATITGTTKKEGELNIPSTVGGYKVTAIGNSAFSNCSKLTGNLVIPEGVTSIGNNAFYYCSSLTGNLVIPESVTAIGSAAFYQCHGLTGTLYIPAGIQMISGGSFTGTAIVEFEVDENNPNYCDIDGVLFTKDKTTIVRYPPGKIGDSYVIPEGVLKIDTSCFHDSQLVSASVPASVITIGNQSFCLAKSLTTILVDKNNTYFCDENGILFNKDKTNILRYPSGRLAESYVVPESVKIVGHSAFQTCRNLKTVQFPSRLETIKPLAFNGARSLSQIMIPSTVKTIEYKAFLACMYLTDAYFYGDVPTSWGTDAFKNTASAFTIHYIEGKSGWTTPTWKASDGTVYNTKTFVPEGEETLETCLLAELTEVDYLALSSLAYRDCADYVGKTIREMLDEEWDEFWEETYITHGELYQHIGNWKIFAISGHGGSGFYVIGVVNNNGEVVLAYRGSTEGNLDNWLHDPDWMPNDFKMFFTGKAGEQVQQAFDFYEYISGMDHFVKRIAVTGHSLGGGLADMVAARYGLYGESFNSAPFLDVAYWNYPEEMAKNFKGVDAYRFVAHVNESDGLVGNWFGENFKPKIVHEDNEFDDAHSLANMIERSAGKLRLTDVLETRMGDNRVTQAVNPFDMRVDYIVLDTRNGDKMHFFPSANNVVGDTFVFAGSGSDTIIGATIVSGGPDDDELDSGLLYTGSDNTYIYWKGHGVDTIRDVQGNDTLLLCGFDDSDVVFVNTYESQEYILIQLNGKTILKIHRDRSFFGGSFTVKGDNIDETDLVPMMKDKKYADLLIIACPVDIEILDSEGKVVYTVKDAEEGAYYTEYGDFYVYKEENGEYGKILRMIEGYTVRIVGVDEGTMDVQVQAQRSDGTLLPVQTLTNIPVSTEMTAAVVKDDQNNASLAIDSDGDGAVNETLTLLYTLEANASSALTFTEDGDDSYISGIPAGSTVSALSESFVTDALSMKDADGNALSADAVLKTGDRIYLMSEDGKTVLDEATIIVTGDVNCDGESDILDLLKAASLMESGLVEIWERLAVDLDRNERIEVDDLIALIRLAVSQ